MSSRKKKTATKRAKSKRGSRYTPKQKADVVAFVHAYNNKHGRGGQSQAVKKFGVTALTIATWLKSPDIGAKAVSGNLKGKIAQLSVVSNKLRKLDEQSAKLRQRRDELLASILGGL